VVLEDAITSDRETGVAASALTVYYRKPSVTAVTQLTIQAGDGSGSGQDCATDGSGSPEDGDFCEDANLKQYRIYAPASLSDTKGRVDLLVSGAGFRVYAPRLYVQTYLANEESDRFPSSGTIPNTATTMPASLDATTKSQLGYVGTVSISSINTVKTGYGNRVTVVQTGVITGSSVMKGYQFECGEEVYTIADTVNGASDVFVIDGFISNTTTGDCDVYRYR